MAFSKNLTSGNKAHLVVGIVLGVVMIAGLSTAADAQSRRPDSRSMTCNQVQSLINERGGVVMSTGRHTFDRYVANRSFCSVGEAVYREWIPTKDNPKCMVRRCDVRNPFLER